MIPRALHQECPIKGKYRERFGTCVCDDHCSWDLCRTVEPENHCIRGTNSVWKWDHLKSAWVAQLHEGTITSMYAKFWREFIYSKHSDNVSSKYAPFSDFIFKNVI